MTGGGIFLDPVSTFTRCQPFAFGVLRFMMSEHHRDIEHFPFYSLHVKRRSAIFHWNCNFYTAWKTVFCSVKIAMFCLFVAASWSSVNFTLHCKRSSATQNGGPPRVNEDSACHLSSHLQRCRGPGMGDHVPHVQGVASKAKAPCISQRLVYLRDPS